MNTAYLFVILGFGVPASALLYRQLRQLHWRAALVTLTLVTALTLVFDNLIVAGGIVGYPVSRVLGVRMPIAPIEDLGYAIFGAVLVPALWLLLGRKADAVKVRVGELIRQLFWASRPVSWINTAYPFAAAYFMATRGTHHIYPAFWVGTLMYLIPYNLLMYGINDVFDYESDLRNPRKGGIEGSVLHPKWHKPTLIAAFLLPIPFLEYFLANFSLPLVALLLFNLFTVVAYSAKGLRFKEIPVLDSITSSTHFFLPMVVGLAFADANLLDPTLLKITVAFALWGMASHAFGAVQDIRADREGGLASIATVFGAKNTVRFALACYLLAGIAVLSAAWPTPLAALAVVPYLAILWPFRNLTDEHCEDSNRGWRRFIWLNFFAGFVVTMLLIFAASS